MIVIDYGMIVAMIPQSYYYLNTLYVTRIHCKITIFGIGVAHFWLANKYVHVKKQCIIMVINYYKQRNYCKKTSSLLQKFRFVHFKIWFIFTSYKKKNTISFKLDNKKSVLCIWNVYQFQL